MGFKLPAPSISGAVDDGMYKATLTNYYGPKDGKFGPYIDFVFTITDDDDYTGQELTFGYCGVGDGRDKGPSKKFTSTCAALNGGEYDEDADLDDYVGNPVTIVVENVEKEDAVYSNITGVKPRRAQRKPAPAKKPKPAVDDFNVEDYEVEDLV